VQQGLGWRTFAQKQAEDNIIQSSSAVDSANMGLTDAYTMIGADGKGSSQIKNVQRIDAGLQQNALDRQALKPQDTAQRRELEEIRNGLLKEREEANTTLATLQGVLAGNLEDLQSVKADLEAKLESGMFDTPENAENKAALLRNLDQVNSAIESSGDAQDKFNKLIQNSVNLAARLKREYSLVVAKVADASATLNLDEAKSKAVLAQQQASGEVSTPGQIQSAQSSLASSNLERRLQQNQEALNSFQNLLADSAITNALDTAKIAPSTGANEMRVTAESLAEGDLQNYVNQAADAKEQVMALQTEASGLEEQIAQNAADTRQSLIDLNKEITAYMHEISVQAAEMARTVQSNEIESAMNSAKADITRAMSEGGDEFFGQFSSFLVEAIEGMFGTIQKLQEFRGTMAQNQEQIYQSMQQAAQLQNQMPGGAAPGSAPGASGSGSGFHSPLRSQSVASLVNYEETAVQSFRATRNRNGVRGLHNGIDFGRRIGGTPGADVVAMEGGTASIRSIGTNASGEQSMQVKIRFTDEQGRPIEYQYNHLSQAAVQRALGRSSGTAQVQAGQSIGAVGTDDNVSEGAHLDLKIKVGDTYVDPQQYMAARAGAGGHAETANRRQVQINSASSAPASRPAAAAPVTARPVTAAPQRAPVAAASTSDLTVKGRQITEAQLQSARTIIAVGQRLGATATDIDSALATAIQESVLVNRSDGHLDSAGLFQQRPSMEWGSQSQVTNAEFAAESFFQGRGSNRGLLDLTAAQRQDPIAASHRVQRSGSPEAPRQWLGEARNIRSAVMSGGAPGAPGAPNAAGAPMAGQIGAGQATLGQGFAQLNQSQSDLYASSLDLDAAQFEQRISNQTRSLRQMGESVQSIVRGVTRAQSDIARSALMDSPMLGLSNELLQIGRDTGDRVRENTETQRNLQDSINGYTKAVEVYESTKVQIEQQIAQLQAQAAGGDVQAGLTAENLIGKLAQMAEYNTAVQEQLAIAQKGADDLKAMIGNEDALLLKAQEAVITRRMVEVEQEGMGDRTASMRRQGRGVEATNLEFDSQVAEVERLAEARKAALAIAIEDVRASGMSAEATESIVASLQRVNAAEEENLQLKLESLGAARAQAQMETQRAFSNQSFEGDVAVGRARLAQGRALGGDTFGMRNAERDIAIAESNHGLTNQLAEIQQTGEAAGYTAEQIQHLQDNATELNSINIGNLKTQFSELPEILAPIKSGFEGFFTDIFSGTKSVGEAFGDMVQNILSSMASLVAQKLVSGLFGSLLGGGMGGGGGILSSIFGMNKGGEVPGLSAGGKVSGAGAASLAQMRKGNDPIGIALRAEGPNSVLGALTPGEVVLTTRQARQYYASGMDQVLNFKKGGRVPGAGSAPKIDMGGGMSSTTITVPITINSDGGKESEGDKDLAQKLKNPIEVLVMQVLQRERRNRGQLADR